MASPEKIDLDDELTPPDSITLNEADRLQFAKQMLFWLFIFCCLIVVLAAFQPENKLIESLVDLIKIGVLPLITLIVSFYFPQSRRD